MNELLVSKARDGNRESLAQLLYNNYEVVFKYLIKFTLNRNTAEDLTQEAMARAIEKFHLYNPEKSQFSTWLVTIAQNIYIDGLRKQKRERQYTQVEYSEMEAEVFDLHDDTWDRVLDSLSKLSGEMRTPLVLKHYYGYSHDEIAALMSIPVGTVKSRIHNALKSLRKEMGENE